MRALTLHAPGDLRLETVPDPAVVEPGDVVVRVRLTAVCGSDLHVYHGRETGLDAGTVMGHEFVGEVVAKGDDVRAFRPGDVVVSPFTTSCGACLACRSGLTARCDRGQLFGWVEGGRGLHGGQAEYVRVPLADATLVAVPDGVPEEEALFAGDVLSTGWFCAENGGVSAGSTVAVIGCGPVGLFAALAARELGATRVFALDSVPERLALAARYGAEPVDIAHGDPRAVVREATEGRGVDAALEAVGTHAATRLAYDLLRPGGTLSAVGVHTEAALAVTPAELYDKNLTYRAGRCPARHYMERALALVRSNTYDLAAIVSHRLALDEGVRGYEIFDQKLDGCTKVLLRP